MTLSVPRITTGTICRLAAKARWKPPFLIGFNTRPSASERVPSGKMRKFMSAGVSLAAWLMDSTACVESPRRMNTIPTSFMLQPKKGIFPKVSLGDEGKPRRNGLHQHRDVGLGQVVAHIDIGAGEIEVLRDLGLNADAKNLNQRSSPKADHCIAAAPRSREKPEQQHHRCVNHSDEGQNDKTIHCPHDIPPRIRCNCEEMRWMRQCDARI